MERKIKILETSHLELNYNTLVRNPDRAKQFDKLRKKQRRKRKFQAIRTLWSQQEAEKMQKMILIPEERYYKMLASYDKAMEEIERLREQLKRQVQKSKEKK